MHRNHTIPAPPARVEGPYGEPALSTDPRGLNFVGAAVLDATDMLAAADTLLTVCDALAQVLDENDGALVRIAEFFTVAAEKARTVGDPMSTLAHEFDVAAELTGQLWERMADVADATRPVVQPVLDRPPSAAMRTAQAQATVRARAAGAPAVVREPTPKSANHPAPAQLMRPAPTSLGAHR